MKTILADHSKRILLYMLPDRRHRGDELSRCSG